MEICSLLHSLKFITVKILYLEKKEVVKTLKCREGLGKVLCSWPEISKFFNTKPQGLKRPHFHIRSSLVYACSPFNIQLKHPRKEDLWSSSLHPESTRKAAHL